MSSTQETRQQLELYIRANYPLIYLQTGEEARACRLLTELALSVDVPLIYWSCTKGFVRENVRVDSSVTKPDQALDFIQRTPDSAIFVLLDFHAHLDQPVVVRKLRDTLDYIVSSTKSLFILSPKKLIPIEFAKDCVVVTLPPPDFAEIETIVDRCLKAAKDRIRVSLTTEDKELLITAFRGLSSNEIENILSLMLARDGTLNANDLGIILEEKGRLIGTSGILQFFPPKESLNEVGGLNNLKAWLQRKRLAFTQQAHNYGLDTPKGVLFVGVPGCGKSLTAKAISNLWQMPLLRLDMGALFSSYIGSTEENMRTALTTAESISPSILWIDEIEKGLAGAQAGDQADGGVARRIFATLLTWMQEKRHPVFVAATANDVSMLPPEFLRKGRFNDIFFIDLPNANERAEILSIHLAKRKRDPNQFTVGDLAAQTEGFSGADLESVVSEALETSYIEGRELNSTDLSNAAAATVPLAVTLAEKIAEVRQWAGGRARRATSA